MFVAPLPEVAWIVRTLKRCVLAGLLDRTAQPPTIPTLSNAANTPSKGYRRDPNRHNMMVDAIASNVCARDPFAVAAGEC